MSGATYASLISAVSAFLFYTVFAYKYYPIPYKTKELILSLILVLTCSYGVFSIFSEINLVSIIVKTIYLLLMGIFISFMLIEKEYLEKIKLKFKRTF